MSIKVELPRDFFDIGDQLEEIKAAIVYEDVPRILAAEQAKGFPKNPDDYTVLLKNRGKTTRRKLSTIKPTFLRIPFSYTIVAKGNMTDVLAAVKMAVDEWRKRAPVRSGTYRSSIIVESNNGTSYRASPETVSPNTRFYISSATAYSSIIEWGFYRRPQYYKTRSLPNGIGFWVKQKVARAFKDSILIRFFYLAGTEGGTFPVIEIATAEAGRAKPDVRPGSKSRKKRRKSFKRGR